MKVRMKVTIRRKWAAALRSDQYKQSKGRLRSINGFCCLGVLCDLHREAHPEYKWKSSGSHYAYGSDAESNYLPWEVMDWAGLKYGDHYVKRPGLRESPLSLLNDEEVPFTKIADLIEASL